VEKGPLTLRNAIPYAVLGKLEPNGRVRLQRGGWSEEEPMASAQQFHRQALIKTPSA